MIVLPSVLFAPRARSLHGANCGSGYSQSVPARPRHSTREGGDEARLLCVPPGAASPLNHTAELASERTLPFKQPGGQSSTSRAGVHLGHNIVWAPPGKLRQRAAGRQQGGTGRRPSTSAPGKAEQGTNPTNPSSRTPLTGLLKKAWSVSQLVAVLQQRPASELNHLNVSFALNKLSKLCKGGASNGGSELQLAFALLERSLLQHAHTYPARSLATALHALAKLRRANPDVFSVAQQRAVQLGHDFTPQGLSKLLWAFSYAGIEAPALFEAMSPLIIRLAPSFLVTELSNVLWAFTAAGSRGSQVGDVFTALQPYVTMHATLLSPQQLATVAWAYTSIANPPEALPLGHLFTVLEEVAVRKEAQFSPHALVRVVRSFATIGQSAPELLVLVEQRVLLRPTNFSAQELSSLARSYGTLKQQAPALFFTLGQEALLRCESFRTRELASIARAAANLGHRVPDLMSAIRERVLSAPRELSSQEAAMICRAFAVLHEPGKGLFEAVEEEVIERGVESFKPQEMANLAHAFTLAGHDVGERFCGVLYISLTQRARDYKPQELVNVAWAVSSMTEPSYEGAEVVQSAAAATLEVVEQEFLRDQTRFNAQDIAQLAWASCRGGAAGQALLDALAAQAVCQQDEFTAQGLANLLCAVASTEKPCPQLYTGLEDAVVRAADAGKFSPQGLALALRAYSTAGGLRRGSELLHSLEAATVAVAEGFTPQGIKYVLRALSTCGTPSIRVLEALEPPIVAHAEEISLQEAAFLLGTYLRAGSGGVALLAALQQRISALAENAEVEAVSGAVLSLVAQAGPLASKSLLPLCEAATACAARMSGEQVVGVLEALHGAAYVHNGVLAALEERVLGGAMLELSAEEVARVARAFAVLGHCSIELGVALERELLLNKPCLTPDEAEAVSRALAMHSGTIPAAIFSLAAAC